MNLSEIIDLTREYLNEPHPVFWTDAQIVSYINVANRKVHATIKGVSKYHFTSRVTFSTTAGTEYYTLPSDCKDIKYVSRFNVDNQEIPLKFAPWPDPYAFVPAGYLDPTTGENADGPTHYVMVGASIRLMPMPAAAVTLKLYYESRIVDLVANTDLPAVDGDYHDMIAKWAAIEAGIKDNKPMETILAAYKIREQDMLQDTLHRFPAPAQETESYIEG